MPRGEQRAMLLLSLLVILALGVRMGVQLLPAREPSGMEAFREEALAILIAREEADSLNRPSEENTLPAGANSSLALTTSSSRSGYQPSRKAPVINLNGADSTALLPLPGIGPVFAGRIIKYRRLLGGYVVKAQLLEVYGIEPGTVDRISPSLYIDSSGVRKLNVNTAAFRELLRHPYLEYEDVKAIVNYRDVEGKIVSFREMWEHGLLADTTLDRVAPYIEF